MRPRGGDGWSELTLAHDVIKDTHYSWRTTVQCKYRQLVGPVDSLTCPNKNTTQITVLLFSLRQHITMYFVIISGQRIPSLVGCSHPGRDGPETLPVKFLRLLASVHGLAAQFVDLPLRSVGGDCEWKGQEGASGCSLLHH